MQLSLFPIVVSLSFFIFAVSPSTAAAAEELHTFYGEVKSVDLAAKTFSIKAGGKLLVFHYDDHTKISSFYEHASWDKIKLGEGATVVMRLGPRNEGIAVEARFEPSAQRAKGLSLMVARTPSGETVSGVAVANFVAFEPRGEKFVRAHSLMSAGQGVYVLSILPDGSVGEITAAKSIGDSEADKRAAHWLRQWRFKPNTVTQVQIPVGVSHTYP